ncbi:MAG: tRNA (N6-isopentenyl adenosine(37)-C2)-methylthiotransferase MiaB [Spirochaetia bacterium]|nr:tRNA (N6-isopentenyl adenosine(37)-C2)-methylthiotransferase MiaB [Spirochaetia bacterium]
MGIPYYLETYGCQMNEYDSLIAATILKNADYSRVDTPDEAKLVLINTCSVRENAQQKIYNRLQSLKRLHKKGTRVAVIGCMAQNLGENLLKQGLPVDFVLGPDELRNLTTLNTQTAYIKTSRTETYEDIIPAIDNHAGIKRENLAASVAIQRGCDKFCSFCVVPYTRGRERSRSVKSIITEIRALVDCGMKSIVLLGQNVNSYNFEQTGFADLLKIILNETDVLRLYYTSPHPQDFPREIIELTAREKRIGNQIHIPLQSGSDEILKKMRRDYTRQEFISLVTAFRDRIPDVSISTDIIVGFCGESDSLFQETLDTVEICQFDFAYTFSYSEREHTFAHKNYPDDIPGEIKSSRLEKLIETQRNIALAINQKYIGEKHYALIEGISKKNSAEMCGSLLNSKKVIIPIPEGKTLFDFSGREYEVEIAHANSQTLRGILTGG